MASGSDEDPFHCWVCSEHFRSKNPRLLECHHSFCERCLHKLLTKDKIRCPKCQKFTSVVGGEVTNLPVNFHIQPLLEETQKIREKMCQVCDESAAVFKCEECHHILCQHCFDNHSKVKRFKDHTVLTLCLKHNEGVFQVCTKCVMPVCFKCLILDHSEHEDMVVGCEEGIKEIQDKLYVIKDENRKHSIKDVIYDEDSKEVNAEYILASYLKENNSEGILDDIDYYLKPKSNKTVQQGSFEEVKLKDEQVLTGYIDMMKLKPENIKETKRDSSENELMYKQEELKLSGYIDVMNLKPENIKETKRDSSENELMWKQEELKLKDEHLLSGYIDLMKLKPENIKEKKRVPSENELMCKPVEQKLIDEHLLSGYIDMMKIKPEHFKETKRDSSENELMCKPVEQKSKDKQVLGGYIDMMKLKPENIKETNKDSQENELMYKPECVANITSSGTLVLKHAVCGTTKWDNAIIFVDYEAKNVTKITEDGDVERVYAIDHAYGVPVSVSIHDNSLYITQSHIITLIDDVDKTKPEMSKFKPKMDIIGEVCVISHTKLICTDFVHGKVYQYDPQEDITKLVLEGVKSPLYVNVMMKGGVKYLVTLGEDNLVQVYNAKWEPVFKVGKGQGSGDGYMFLPCGAICVDEGILVADSINNRVCLFDFWGEFVRHLLTVDDGIKCPRGLVYRKPRLWVICKAKILCFKVKEY